MGEAFAWLAMSVIFQGVSMFQKSSAADARIEQLKLESQQSSLKRTQESISNYDILERTIATQTAQSTTRGVAMGSPSLEAIQVNSINKIAKEEKNLDLEESLFKNQLKIEKANVKQSLYSSLFGDVASTGLSLYGFSKSTPKAK